MRAHLERIGLGVLGVLHCAPAQSPARVEVATVRPGIEVLLSDSLHLIRGRAVGLLTNHTGVDRQGRRDVDLLRAADVRVTALFTPEHGFRGTEDRPELASAADSATGLPIYSVYGATRTPDLRALDAIEVLLVDLQDIGARYYTYASTAVLLMRDAAARGVPVVVLDRPNPIGGVLVQGNVRPRTGAFTPFVGFLPVAMRHGMTLGELLRFANEELGIGADLTVVPAAGWYRNRLADATGLPWVRPSPAMPSLESALHYPGLCLFEGTNLSVGRGTDLAFQVVGAPWVDPAALLARLAVDARGRTTHPGLAGVALQSVAFTPREPPDGKFGGARVHGIRLRVFDPEHYDPTRAAVALLAALRATHADSFRFRPAWFDMLAGEAALRGALESGAPATAVWSGWDDALAAFSARRAKYLLY